MSDNVSSDTQLGCIGDMPLDFLALIDWHEWEASESSQHLDWVGGADDAGQGRAIRTTNNRSDQPEHCIGESTGDPPNHLTDEQPIPQHSIEPTLEYGTWSCYPANGSMQDLSVLDSGDWIPTQALNNYWFFECTATNKNLTYRPGNGPEGVDIGIDTQRLQFLHDSCRALAAPNATNGEAVHPNTRVAAAPSTASSAIQKTATGTAVGRSNKVFKRGRQLICPYGDCTHDGTFPRRYELDRHIRVRHNSRKPFSCPYLGCLKGKTAPTFARLDKLTAHIRGVHRRHQTRQLKCPDSDCQAPAMELDLLGMHIKKRHSRSWPTSEHLRAVANAASPARFPCPLWCCSETPLLQKLIPHLLEHSQHDLEYMAHDLLAYYYALGPPLPTDDAVGQSHTEDSLTSGPPDRLIYVVCPMCKLLCDDHATFENHFDEVHAIRVQYRAHFQTWRRYARENRYITSRGKGDFKPWLQWLICGLPRNEVVRCPDHDCLYENISELKFRWVDCGHHVEMLADLDDIKPYRREILKLYPEFDTHPVWDDMK